MKEINYQFRERFSIVHKKDRRDKSKIPAENQIEITDKWCITIPKDADTVLINAARDLEDYFFTSMEISLKVIRESETNNSEYRIVYRTDNSIAENSYRFKITNNEVIFIGHDSRMTAQAGYFAEDLMNIAEAPYLERQDITRTSLFNPRMVHSGYGLDMFPTEHLINIAHAGISSLLVFITNVDMTPHGYHDFNDLCRRASDYGLSVYAYSYLANKMHPDDDGAEEFYENLYGTFLDRCPYFKGIIFVGESFEFPSKDTHTTGIRRLDNKGPDGKPLVTGKYNPGWWPCYDYPDLINMIKKIIFNRNPEFDIVFWSYNWNSAPAEAREALIKTLPKDITLQATFEMGDYVERDGIKNRVADYSIYTPGPGYYFRTESKFAKENGLRLYSMTNTGGMTWDVGVVPYIPAPYQWIKRYEGMIEAHETVGLVGTMDSHHFGFCPSFISDLAKWAFYSPKVDLEDVLHKLAERDFSANFADSVLEAYKYFSDGTNNMIATNPDQYGPMRCGPAFPLVLFDDKDLKIPTVPYAHFGGNRICYINYGADIAGGVYKILNLVDTEEKLEKFKHEIKCFEKCADYYKRGADILEKILPELPERKTDNAKRIYTLARFIEKSANGAVNTKKFYLCKNALLDTHGEKRNKLVDEMINICKCDRENAIETIPLVEFDSRLGYEPSMEYMCDRAHLEWKIAQITRVIEEELPRYYE